MTEFPFLYCQDSLGSSDINPTQQRSSVSLCASVSVSFCFTVSLLYFFCLCFSLHCYFRQIFLPVVEIMDANNTWLLSFHVHYTQSPKQDTSPGLVENYWSGLWLWAPCLQLLLLLLLSRFSHVWPCATPQTAAHQTPPSLGFSKREHWSGLPFPSPIYKSEKWK